MSQEYWLFLIPDNMMTLFSRLNKISKHHYLFGAFILLFCSVFSLVEIKNSKLEMNDFRVYFDAVNDFFNGNNPYVKHYGLNTGFFKYPPTTLYLFSPATLLDYSSAKMIHLVILFFSIVISIPLVHNLCKKLLGVDLNNKQRWILYVSFICVAIHLSRELHMGNVNLILLLLFVLGLHFLNDKKLIPAALFWSLMLIMKPIMILAVIPLPFFKQWRLIGYMAGAGILFFLLPMINLGWIGNLEIWGNWFKAIASHGDYIVSENSLTYLTHFYLGIDSTWIPSLCMLAVLMVAFIFDRYFNKKGDTNLTIWLIIFTAFIPNFFVTDTEHFLLSLPLIILLLTLLSKIKKRYYWIGFFLGMLLFSFKSNDLLGKQLTEFANSHGVIGIGNLVFLFTVVYIWLKNSIISKETVQQ